MRWPHRCNKSDTHPRRWATISNTRGIRSKGGEGGNANCCGTPQSGCAKASTPAVSGHQKMSLSRESVCYYGWQTCQVYGVPVASPKIEKQQAPMQQITGFTPPCHSIGQLVLLSQLGTSYTTLSTIKTIPRRPHEISDFHPLAFLYTILHEWGRAVSTTAHGLYPSSPPHSPV